MELFVALIFFIVVSLVLFLALRKAVLWYFKVDEQIAVLKDIKDQLRRIADNKDMA